MKQYKATFKLSTPLAVNYPYLPTFDGILAYGYIRSIYSDKDAREKYLSELPESEHTDFVKSLPFVPFIPQQMSYSQNEMFVFQNMPLKLSKCRKYFIASQMQMAVDNQYFGYIRKQWDKTRAPFTGHIKNIRINLGVTKSVQIEIPLRECKEVSFDFTSDNISDVEKLLQYITGFGKKHNRQWGKIENFIISENPYNENIINRPIPESLVSPEMLKETLESGIDLFTLYTAFYPPYHQSNNELCLMPK